MPKVSVIMPVYNCEPYLAEAIESILGQTLADMEFIIIDDGSTDRSFETIRRYARRDARIRAISRENRGIVRTRNEGLELARGEYLAIMDGDDVSLPDRLLRQAEYLDTHDDCLIVTCRMELTDPQGDPLLIINQETTHEEIDAAHLALNSFTVTGGYMARLEAVRAVGGYDERVALAEDRDLFLRLAERGKVACIPEVLYRYRQHVRSSCHSRDVRLRSDVEAVIAAAWARRGLPGEPPVFPPDAGGPTDSNGIHRKWGWWALKAGHVRTARKHALLSLRNHFFSWDSWRLLVCALRGH
ncbi:MAG TPA: glycosyltransferase [Phycisphaerae bacterium]|nr:glycosyltransferase [Phycisphaerae bacterium]HOJ74432.1 glycosyltransferase [Phycisphaerae bacterium]HON66884.1 glycosyltransferase [Phycisphaerae bacterium]HPP27095.1 glycosyltransferase [Phycisphaerae bacterium]HPU27279.1 glycosyltransferase [Phycisphaerae bacterium]